LANRTGPKGGRLPVARVGSACLEKRLVVHINEEGLRAGIDPIRSAFHTVMMKTQALRQALTVHGFDAAINGARRDEEKSRAKERVFSQRSGSQGWDPKNQRPEVWHLYNARLAPGASMRVFPLSDWTESDVWSYGARENIPAVPLYFARPRPVVRRNGTWIVLSTTCDASASRLSGGGQMRVPNSVAQRSAFCELSTKLAKYCAILRTPHPVPDNLCALLRSGYRP
jgi:3'-phosphoadenosine 5'-phosphosulfate sulfotransferase (PAPS reductase)/FAD synthetase